MKRGDVVIADFPFQDVPGSKIRPAVVVQNDADNAALPDTILAMPEGAGSGLSGPSLIKCGNLATVRQARVERIIGHLSDALMWKVDGALKAALALP